MSIPAASVYVGIVRLAVGSLARAAGFDEERIDEIRIAVSEACTNAVQTNLDAQADEPVSIEWREEDSEVVVIVADRSGDPGEQAPGNFDSQGFSSRLMMSVALLREVVDELSFEPRDGGGTLTRLRFTLPA